MTTRTATGRGIHSRPNDGQTVDWITPPEIVKALGPFNLDPCAHPAQPYRTARHMIQPPADGLACNWTGRVWLNPPYGRSVGTWLSRLVDHGNGIALVAARTEVEVWFWPYVWEGADAVLFLRGRLNFLLPDGSRVRPDGRKTGNAGHGSVLAAYGSSNAKRLLASEIPGRFIDLKRKQVLR